MPHTLTLPDELTADTVIAAQQLLAQAIAAAPAKAAIVLDAAQVRSFDSACLAMLLECRRLAQSTHKTLAVSVWTPSLQSLAKMYGVLHLLDPTAVETDVVLELP